MHYNYNQNRINHNDKSKLSDSSKGSNMEFKRNDTDTWTLVSMNKKQFYRKDSDTFNDKSSNHSNSYTLNMNERKIRHDETGKIIRTGSDKRDMNNDSRHYSRYENRYGTYQDQSHKIYNNDENDSEKYKNDNYKKILCKNINSVGKCIYTHKCLYAHSIDEQNVESIRVIAYDMIKKNNDLSHIDLTKNKQLYTNLLALSKVCQQCDEGTCTGGYNCKHGACDKIYVICQTDLNKGTCEGKCGKIHLTKKGLVPYGINIVKNLKSNIVIPKATIINEEFFKRLNDNISNQNINNQSDDRNNNNFKPILEQESNNKPQNDCDNESSDSNISIDEQNTWATIVKNESPSSSNIRVIKHIPIDDCGSTKNDDSMDSESYDDDLFTRLHSVGKVSDETAFDKAFNQEDKLNRSIFKIDIMCI
jgi:hypothetical protein